MHDVVVQRSFYFCVLHLVSFAGAEQFRPLHVRDVHHGLKAQSRPQARGYRASRPKRADMVAKLGFDGSAHIDSVLSVSESSVANSNVPIRNEASGGNSSSSTAAATAHGAVGERSFAVLGSWGVDSKAATGIAAFNDEPALSRTRLPNITQALMASPSTAAFTPAQSQNDVDTINGNRAFFTDIQRIRPIPAQDLAGLAEYQCASESSTPTPSCKECKMSTFCECTGYVKFGYGDFWSDWVVAKGNQSCDVSTFGQDPFPGHDKICMCQPQAFTCASELSTPTDDCLECTFSRTCTCEGEVRFGYGSQWTSWVSASGPIECNASFFHADPFPGHGKLCQCRPSIASLAASELLQKQPIMRDIFLSAIIVVAGTYFLLHAALACVRSNNQFANIPPTPWEQVLESTVSWHAYFGPMLCHLFLTARQRVETLTSGHPQEYGYPPPYLENAAIICAAAYMVLTLCHMMSEASAQAIVEIPAHEVHANASPMSSLGLSTVVHVQTPSQVRTSKLWQRGCQLGNLVAYASLAIVIVGVCWLREPQDLVEAAGKLPTRMGTLCSMALAFGYFLMYFILYALRSKTAAQMERGGPPTNFGLEVVKLGATGMNIAPMLCALFLGIQLAVDWHFMTLPAHASSFILLCTIAVFLQVGLLVIAPFLAKAELQASGPRGEVDFVTRNHRTFVVISLIRWAAMAALYAGVVWFAMLLLRSNGLPSLMRPLCQLAAVYFFAYLLLWAAITAQTILRDGFSHSIRALTVAKDTVVFCPVLAALFMAAWVRAHELDTPAGHVGEPQGYVQRALQIAVLAVAMQLAVVLLSGAILKPPPSGGIYQDPCEKMGFTPVFFVAYHFAVILLHSSVALTILGVCLLSPQTATGFSM